MKKLTFIPAVFAVSLFMAACSSTPTTTSMLDRARGDYMAAQNNPSVAASAPLEFKAASDALNRANDAAAKNDSLEHIDQLAYIATQKIATAQQVAKQKSAEANIADASRQRDEVRLQQRTQEADQAKAAADQARMQAMQAQNDAANANAATADAQARATALAAELADLQAKQTERGMVITLSDVLFNTDRAELSADGMATARKLATVLTQNPERSVLIEGFTDSTGSAAHNLELSQRRAESVRAALVGLGVSADRVATKGYGEAYPVAANDSSGDRQLNRRVEIVLSQNGNPIAARR
ncbi:OmpA family protein [Rugamonas sp.]|uniref:OmpA family protein n=1 Tax=Rugamonas sp. TaxID=1926287 RepID=UPI0025DC74C0|nr:OmpA family protein [Rugamonas sp.]